MKLFLRGDVYWVRWSLNGRQMRKSTGLSDKAEATKWARANVGDIEGDKSLDKLLVAVKNKALSKSMDNAEMLDYYLSGRDVSISHRRWIQRYWDMWCGYCGVAWDASDIQAKQYVASLLSQDISRRTVTAHITAAKSVYGALVKSKRIASNPFELVAPPRLDTVSREAFSRAELALMGEHDDDPCFALVAIGISTGLRLGDMCRLKWEQVQSGFLSVKQHKTGELVSIPIVPALSEYLSRLPKESEWILPEWQDMYAKDQSVISKKFKHFLAVCGIGGAKKTVRQRQSSVKDIHSLRHTFAYIAASNHIPMPIVQSILGHMTPAMTRHYADHAQAEDKQRYMAALPDYFGSAETAPKPDIAKRIKNIVKKTNEINFESRKRHILRLLEKKA